MKNKKSIYFIVAISLTVALLHIPAGPGYQGIYPHFVRGYLMDILLPMNLYLLLQLSLRKKLALKKARIIGALCPVLFGILVEFLQRIKIAFFGSTYDPMDMLMYGIGVLLGLAIDIFMIDRFERQDI